MKGIPFFETQIIKVLFQRGLSGLCGGCIETGKLDKRSLEIIATMPCQFALITLAMSYTEVQSILISILILILIRKQQSCCKFESSFVF